MSHITSTLMILYSQDDNITCIGVRVLFRNYDVLDQKVWAVALRRCERVVSGAAASIATAAYLRVRVEPDRKPELGLARMLCWGAEVPEAAAARRGG